MVGVKVVSLVFCKFHLKFREITRTGKHKLFEPGKIDTKGKDANTL